MNYTLVGPDGNPYQSRHPGKLGGHRKTRIYGQLDCRAARAAVARGGYVKQRVFFARERDAIGAGFRPCAVCMPEKYRDWMAQTRTAPRPTRRRAG